MRDPRTVRLPDARCPCCHKLLDAATAMPRAGKAKPRRGDFGVCVGCGALLRYGRSLQVAEATDAEKRELAPAQAADIAKAQANIRSRNLLTWKKAGHA